MTETEDVIYYKIMTDGTLIGGIHSEIHGKTVYATLFEMFYAWNRKKQKLNRGEISREEYVTFRYNFTLKDAGVKTVTVPDKELVSDLDI